MSTTDIKQVVKEKYGQAALRVKTGGSRCCGVTAASGLGCDPITSNLYNSSDAGQVPEDAMLASLGCGNPTALAKLNPGEVVLDLGSGGGIDVLLSAKRVGPTGKAYGLDMTEEMLSRSRAAAATMGLSNVEFRRGVIEALPIEDGWADVVISNGVINLCADKRQVFFEVTRVLRSGGRLQFADIANGKEVPAGALRNIDLWTD